MRHIPAGGTSHNHTAAQSCRHNRYQKNSYFDSVAQGGYAEACCCNRGDKKNNHQGNKDALDVHHPRLYLPGIEYQTGEKKYQNDNGIRPVMKLEPPADPGDGFGCISQRYSKNKHKSCNEPVFFNPSGQSAISPSVETFQFRKKEKFPFYERFKF
jgi:hypothetical protein